MKLDDLKYVPEYQSALKPLEPERRAGLRREIIRFEHIHTPILWHFNKEGEQLILDGYHRLQIRDELNADGIEIPVPQFKEAPLLSGDSIEVAVKWIKEFQASRRNETKIEKEFKAGLEATALQHGGKTATEIAKITGTTTSKVNHSKVLVRNIEKLKAVDPDKADELLADPKSTIKAVQEALAAAKSVPEEKPKQSQTNRDVNRRAKNKKAAALKTPKGMLAAFKPMREAVRKLSRTTFAVSKAHGESIEYKAIVKKIGEIDLLMTTWEDSSVTK